MEEIIDFNLKDDFLNNFEKLKKSIDELENNKYEYKWFKIYLFITIQSLFVYVLSAE
jgi:hypothetical protein